MIGPGPEGPFECVEKLRGERARSEEVGFSGQRCCVRGSFYIT
jgi:hypothetical protein